MNCEAVQNRLLDLLDLTIVPGDLSAHLSGCDLCRRFVDRAMLLNEELTELEAPSSEDAKMLFLDSVRSLGPVIKTRPSTAIPGLSFRQMFQKLPPRPTLATAAGLLAAVGVGFWAVSPKSSPTAVAKVDPPRHELLQKVTAYYGQFAEIRTPQERVAKLTDLAHDLRNETESLAKVARQEDLLPLARMYENVVDKGIVKIAEQMTQFNTPLTERKAALNLAATELSQTATDFTKLMPTASQQLQPILQRIVTAAQEGEARLLKLADGST
jgi:hypothetical protein